VGLLVVVAEVRQRSMQAVWVVAELPDRRIAGPAEEAPDSACLVAVIDAGWAPASSLACSLEWPSADRAGSVLAGVQGRELRFGQAVPSLPLCGLIALNVGLSVRVAGCAPCFTIPGGAISVLLPDLGAVFCSVLGRSPQDAIAVFGAVAFLIFCSGFSRFVGHGTP
jgi:hypothetical protein